MNGKPAGSPRAWRCAGIVDETTPCYEWGREWEWKDGRWNAFCATHLNRPTKPAPDPGQDTLFDDTPGLARRDGNDTSKAAAGTVKTGTRRWKVWKMVQHAGHNGVTDYELEQRLSSVYPSERWTYSDYSPRRRELEQGGYVADSGERRPNPQTGAAQVVWKAVNQ